jgi:hypothetical protein
MIKVEEPSTIKTFKSIKDREPKADWIISTEDVKEFIKELTKDCPYLQTTNKDPFEDNDKENG